jgi:chromosome partitioning protein
MRYAIWNNKGGVGKTFLSFILSTEYANKNPNKKIIVVDMCPQANLSEIILGGNGKGSSNIDKLISQGSDRLTIGGYFDKRISSPHKITGDETSFIQHIKKHNDQLPDNLYLICGDPSLEIQAQVINQISTQTLPADAWKNVHQWLSDLIAACVSKLGDCTVFIDCNPSFSAYTELAMAAADRVIVPCTSDGSSARAIDNVAALLYGIGSEVQHKDATYSAKAEKFNIPLPLLHSVILNRSTQYNNRTSKAFSAMFDKIKERVQFFKKDAPKIFISAPEIFQDMPDSHSVAIVCSHLGTPLYSVTPGQYQVHDTDPRVNPEPLNRYKEAVEKLLSIL